MNNIQLELLPDGTNVKCWCKCGAECLGRLRTYANGTKHAMATCPKCGKTDCKQMRLTGSLGDIEHILKGLECKIKGMPTGEYDEAVAMVERFAKRMLREDNEPW